MAFSRPGFFEAVLFSRPGCFGVGVFLGRGFSGAVFFRGRFFLRRVLFEAGVFAGWGFLGLCRPGHVSGHILQHTAEAYFRHAQRPPPRPYQQDAFLVQLALL